MVLDKLYLQGEDQAKAAYKNNMTLSQRVPFLLFIALTGPMLFMDRSLKPRNRPGSKASSLW